MNDETIHHCPSCGNRLYPRTGGNVCKNFRCPLFHKCGGGWVRSPSGLWFFQDARAFRDMKDGIFPPFIDYDRLAMGALALAGYKKSKVK